jgi:hypothetical protein
VGVEAHAFKEARMPHHRARFTALGRWDVARHVIEEGEVEAAAICELRERTGWSPRRLADEPGVNRPHSTVHHVLRRGGCSRRPTPDRPTVLRYEWPCPGQLLHMDVKRFGKFTEPGHTLTGTRAVRSRRIGWEYVHSIVDDCSRVAYSDQRSTTTNKPRP